MSNLSETSEVANSQVALRERLEVFGLELVREAVGSGGSATVHEAVTLSTFPAPPSPGTPVAVKQYKPELLLRDGQLERVRQEAELGSRLEHPNIIKIYGLLPSRELPEFLVMAWNSGQTLNNWLKDHADASWDLTSEIATALCNGLQHMHSANVMHRDLKPENVMMTADNQPTIMDVGVAEIVTGAETLHTNLGEFLGSIRYASPQYIAGEEFTSADDVYGLGGVFYELFSGRRMFEGHERKANLPVIIAQEGQRVPSLREGVPAPIQVLVQSMLHRDRARRPKLTDVLATLQDPIGSRFVTDELQRQSAEERGWRVVRIVSDGLSFFADLGSSNSYLDTEFTVVRRGEAVRVPSLSRDTVPEQWVGTAKLKHVHNNVGHFILLGKRWVPGKDPWQSITGSFGRSQGHWVDYEQVATSVKLGDWVLREPRG